MILYLDASALVKRYVAEHLATALTWREMLGGIVSVATYDRKLWRGAQASGLSAWPASIP